ncbi:alpha/beta hydrolase [Streptomyces sulphureus]|uniref:alpha/beta hydrolase n=1 Tax=Streptomyces sulphureus TaxID=47758 RepID=UPI00036FD1A7|nr:alpha/beta hydrolase [Streptomyces sulphureus]
MHSRLRIRPGRGRSAARRPAAVVLAAALLAAGCSAGDGGDTSDGSSRGAGSGAKDPGDPEAKPLEPLPTEVPKSLKPYYAQKLTWDSCGQTGFECAELRAPLDYDSPRKSEELKLSVVRKKTEGDGRRIGSLQVNPGGPGGSAIDYVQQAAALSYPQAVRDRYDIVGMDPRGVARSEPIECLDDAGMDTFTTVDQTPDDAEEVGQLTSAYKKFAEGCKKRSGARLAHVSTTEAARDMDLLRSALGDDRLYYLGASYGTYLGATYAGLYPQRAGRLVLDGAMDPSLSSLRINREQTGGFETAFRAFAEDCVGRTDCPLGTGSVKEAGERLAAFFKKTDAHPLKTDQKGRRLTESLATTGVIRAMYDEGSWPALREALKDAQRGNGSSLLMLSDDYYERSPDGSYSNIMYANPAVNCLDIPPAFDGPGDVRKALPSFEKASPVFGRGFAWAALNCAYWQTDPADEPHTIEAKDAAPIVVVGTTRDPATPYRWAEGLAAQLSSARLLTYDGDGHTAYLRGSSCIDSAINDYLLSNKPPKDGTTCS